MEFSTWMDEGLLAPTLENMATALATQGLEIDTGHWQGQENVPMTNTRELINARLVTSVPVGVVEPAARWAELTLPNMPWAEKHFMERISGIPLNPPPSHVEWPYAQKDNDEHTDSGVFSHTYPERLWPKEAKVHGDSPHWGIRYPYGDLGDVVELLKKHPHTRQAYVPLWFPEDTGAVDGQRVPCTLGYHFMRRNARLYCFYPIRSCDFLRHFQDDVYMAGRLAQWVVETCGWKDEITDITLTMDMVSLHVFEADMQILKAKYGVIST